MTQHDDEAAAPDLPGPLDGFRIIDVTSMVAAPIATMLLGDQGAEVIKVEAPAGDLVRRFGIRREGLPAPFVASNRNKRSIVLNLKESMGIELLKRLVSDADVFVQNFRPGTAERMGIGEADLRAIKPDLIYVSISGFGEKGPYADQRVYDPVIQALCGLAAIQTDWQTQRPQMVRTVIPDKLTGITAAQAITAALLARERTGVGQHVRLSMLDAMIAFLWPEGLARLTYADAEPGTFRPQTRDLVFETTDGFMTAGANSDVEWAGLCRVLEKPEWLEDERFKNTALRALHIAARLELTGEVLATRSTAYWLERLRAAQVPCAPILTREELLSDPQIAANEIIIETEHPHAGPMRMARPAARFDRTPASVRRHAPKLGEHTDEVLAELGIGASEIATLREEGVAG
jgi:crotonobetainyl-CoA:carnitine CoA-transferase CaiB-like acyl-CoA transferase